jgi:hypothetical protein
MTDKKEPDLTIRPNRMILREGYKESTKTWHPEGKHGYAAGTQTEHWDGRLDANARPSPVKIESKVPTPSMKEQ